jgi:arylsulfatase A-like enzyme
VTRPRGTTVLARVAGLALLVHALGISLALLAPSAARAQPRPNVVLVLADDLGRAEIGAHGQTRLRTPALDALAMRAAVFEAAYSNAPVCAPSRCSILTGLQAGHCPVFENDEPNLPLESRDPTIAELLAQAGYRSAMVGKWALGGELDDGTPWNVQSAPWRVGFTDVFSVLDQEIAQDHYPGWLWSARSGAPSVEVLAGNAEGARARYAPDLFSERALAFVREAPEPFFLYLPTTLPHRELVPPPGSEADASDADATYAAMVERLDAHVGALLEALAARGIAGRTLVVFTSDNGPNAIDGHTLERFASRGELRGQKRDLYEGGIRVPLLVAGPGVRARRISEPVMLADLLPTFTSLAGAPTPPTIDGRSLVSLLANEVVPSEPLHDHLYFECNERRGGIEELTRRAVRQGRWKWVRRGQRDELYDLEVDPSERTDRAGSEVEIASRLAAIAERDDAPRVAMAAPALRVRANGVEDSRPLRTDGPTPLLVLDPGDVEDDGRSWPQRLEAPELVATLNGPELVRAERSHLRFDREGHDHVVVPSHPALAVFGRSFSLRAVLRVGRLAARAEADERQWLVLAKPTGVHDDNASFGLLVQGGDLGCAEEAPHACTGREIVVVFGDPRLEPARPIVLASTITIDDDAMHELVLHVDRERGRLELVLDERRESIPFFVSPGIGAEAPIVIGAHHDARGRFDHGFAGELHRLVLAEGQATDRDLRRLQRLSAPRHLRVELGALTLGETPRIALELESLALPGAHWIRSEIELDRDAHASLEGTASAVLFGGDRLEIGVLLAPARQGRFAADLTVRALRGRAGTLVEGAPVRVHVRATVHAREVERVAGPSVGLGLARGLGLGAGAVLLFVSIAAWRARRAR